MILTVTPNTAIDRTIEVPHFHVGGTLKGRVVARSPAGKGVNASRTLAALDTPSAVSGFVGAEDEPAFRRSFDHTPARVDLVPVSQPTRRDTTLIDPVNATVTHVREQGFTIDGQDLARLEAKLDEVLPTVSTVVIAGSLPPGMDGDALAARIAQCKRAGARVCVDANGPGLAAAVEEGCALIKPNAEELAGITGRPVHWAEDAAGQARTLLGQVEIVVVSLAEEGAVCVTSEGTWQGRVLVPQDQVVNTVGCGDAFVGGFLYGLDRGVDMADCLAMALACGSANALTASAGTVDARAVERLRAQVNLRQMGLGTVS